MRLTPEPSHPEHIYQRQVALAVSGVTRGQIEDWEERGHWYYTGPPVRPRLFCLQDILMLAMARRLVGVGFSAFFTHSFLRQLVERFKCVPATGFVVFREGHHGRYLGCWEDGIVSNDVAGLLTDEVDTLIILRLDSMLAEVRQKLQDRQKEKEEEVNVE